MKTCVANQAKNSFSSEKTKKMQKEDKMAENFKKGFGQASVCPCTQKVVKYTTTTMVH